MNPGCRPRYSQPMRFATIRTIDGTTAARLDGDVLVPLDAADVGAMLAGGGTATAERAGATPVRPARPASRRCSRARPRCCA